MNDILGNKAAIIERCLKRIREEYSNDPERLKNFTYQDAIVLNLERACQAAIDIAMHVVAQKHLGVPQNSAHAFDLLCEGGHITPQLAKQMKAMTGFRNIAVHEYRNLSLDVLQHVIEHGLKDFADFCAVFGLKIQLP